MSEKIKVKPEETTVLQYVKAATSSSDRVHTVLIVMVTASVLTLVGFRNSEPGGGWLDHRINLRQDALRFFDAGFDPNGPSLTAEERERYARAKQFIDNAKLDVKSLDDKEQLREEIQELRKVRIEKIRWYSLQVPIVGAALEFDMNDMGILAGITFTIILLWFRYSLSRQLSNFRFVFKEAEERGQLKLCYDLLAMEQVMTVPPIEGQERKESWVIIAKMLFLMPVLILANLLILNWNSRSFGNILSPKLMTRLLIVNAVAVFVCLILTFQCLYLSWQLERVWKEEAQKVCPRAKQSDKTSLS